MLYAIREARNNQDGGAAYGVMQEAQALQIVKREMGISAESFVDLHLPTMRHQTATVSRPKPLNFVIMLQESLGAEFVGALGGMPVTPNLDALTKEGIWFDNLYATGTRSVRGIEAVVAGFPPTSVEATVKQNKAQRGFLHWPVRSKIKLIPPRSFTAVNRISTICAVISWAMVLRR
ncbi:MAG: sulfatase-like hydrolase/transferase [Brachymonas sp.]|nr:sulfatase-like hydrolase/transferase [Brachymonas sp.]